ncbi:MAG: hypothetical protein E6Q97_12110 [Desulfurellales bacterium]|nr:MAG: hypothetical protein E6Q97_12110 [Desulfurellales bacterium]
MDVTQEAMKYLRMGLSVIPLYEGSKMAAVDWKQFQQRKPCMAEVVNWYAANPNWGVGIVCGSVSGGLVVRDFDDTKLYDTWLRAYTGPRLPTVQTSRGYHVYFRTKQPVRLQKCDGGEIRGEGSYVVAPPSVHQDGGYYQWHIPLVDLPVLSVDQCRSIITLSSFIHPITPNTHITPIIQLDPPPGSPILRAILDCVPTGPGQRNQCLWRLAGKLKAIEQTAELGSDQLKHLLEIWYEKAEPFIRTKGFQKSFEDFAEQWEYRRVPEGVSLLQRCMERAMLSPPPKRSDGTGKEVQLLAGICRELQKANPEQPFFLSQEALEKITGISQSGVSRKLKILCSLRILSKVSEHDHARRRCASYRYVAPLDE